MSENQKDSGSRDQIQAQKSPPTGSARRTASGAPSTSATLRTPWPATVRVTIEPAETTEPGRRVVLERANDGSCWIGTEDDGTRTLIPPTIFHAIGLDIPRGGLRRFWLVARE